MARKENIKATVALPAEEAAEHLSHIALGVATGEIRFADDSNDTNLHPGRLIHMELKGAEDGERGRLRIDISWDTRLRVDPAGINTVLR